MMKTLKEHIGLRRISLTHLIGNYYGGIFVTQFQDKYYWLIENYDTDFNEEEEWQEIPFKMYEMLITLDRLYSEKDFLKQTE